MVVSESSVLKINKTFDQSTKSVLIKMYIDPLVHSQMVFFKSTKFCACALSVYVCQPCQLLMKI